MPLDGGQITDRAVKHEPGYAFGLRCDCQYLSPDTVMLIVRLNDEDVSALRPGRPQRGS